MPVLNPAELWQRSGRYDIDEVFKLQDRRGAEMVLALTHEEVVTFHVANIVRSYRQLPFSLYHFQTKGRDEARPRAGLLRTREFIMKDAYTFDRDRAGLDEHYERFRGAYDRIFDRVGLEWYRVESDVGMMGGVGAHEYMAPCPAGENDVALAPGYAANVEVASAEAAPVELPEPLAAPEEVPTPGLTTIAEVAGKLGLPEGALLKAFPVIAEGPRSRTGRRARRPPDQRHQAHQRARGAVPARERGRVRPAHRARRLDGPGRRRRAGAARRRRRARPVRHRRQPRGPPPARGRAGPRLPLQARRRPARRARRHRRRPPDPHRARDRGRQHLQARHALLRGVRRDLPRRVRGRAADLDGLLRHRARRASAPPPSSSPPTSRGSRGRGRSRRSTSTSSASAARARRSARSPSGSTTSCARPGSTSSTTTARTSGRAASSPTPSCSAARCA